MRKMVVKNALSKQSRDKVWIRGVLNTLFDHGKVTLVLGKAQRVKTVVDTLLSQARTESLASVRHNEHQVGDYALSKKIAVLAKMSKRNSGFVSMKKVSMRRGDGATMARLELLDTVKLAPTQIKKESNA